MSGGISKPVKIIPITKKKSDVSVNFVEKNSKLHHLKFMEIGDFIAVRFVIIKIVQSDLVVRTTPLIKAK